MNGPAVLRRLVTILRMLIGAAFVALGAMKLNNPEFLYGGIFRALEEAGKPYAFYQPLLNRFEFRQELLAHAVSIGEILLGVSYLSGALVSLASCAGAFLMINIALATSAGNIANLVVHLGFAVILLAMGRAGAGLQWGLDGWLAERVHEGLVLFPLRWRLHGW